MTVEGRDASARGSRDGAGAARVASRDPGAAEGVAAQQDGRVADVALPLRRLRLELDRTLRSRAFFARAAAGRLRRGEYLDLVVQLASLVSALARESAADVLALASADVEALREPSSSLPPRCPAVELAVDAFRAEAGRSWAADVSLAVLGTSWVVDASDGLAPRFPRATHLLGDLTWRSRGSLERVGTRLAGAAQEDVQRVYAFGELARGALLGLTTYLDLAWPAPTGRLRVEPEEAFGAVRADSPALRRVEAAGEVDDAGDDGRGYTGG